MTKIVLLCLIFISLNNVDSRRLGDDPPQIRPQGRRYIRISIPGDYTWYQAKKVCEDEARGLAVIRNEDDNINANIACHQTIVDHCWIGLTDIDNEGEFKWIDGSNLAFTDWHPGEPNDQGRVEDCAVIYDSFDDGWNDYHCNLTFPALCLLSDTGGVAPPPLVRGTDSPTIRPQSTDGCSIENCHQYYESCYTEICSNNTRIEFDLCDGPLEPFCKCNIGYEWNTRTKKCECGGRPLNIQFLVDESGSITDTLFAQITDVIDNIIRNQIISGSHVDITLFSKLTRNVTDTFVGTNNKNALLNQLRRKSRRYWTRTNTRTNNALLNGINQKWDPLLFGGNNDDQTPNLILLLTDGRPSDGESPCSPENSDIINLLNQRRIDVIVVGIGIDSANDAFIDALSCLYRNRIGNGLGRAIFYQNATNIDQLFDSFQDTLCQNSNSNNNNQISLQ